MSTTKKQQVAELLYDLPTGKISTDTIRWIMSHLPDSNEKGDNAQRPSRFKHDEEELHHALGLTDQGILDLAVKFQNSFPEKEDAKKSLVMEKFYPQLNDAEKAFLVSEGIPPFQQFASQFVVERFGAEGYEKLHGVKLDEEDKKKLTAFKELQKHLEALKNIFGGGRKPDGQ